MKITSWLYRGTAPKQKQKRISAKKNRLPISCGEGFYEITFQSPAQGTLVLSLNSPRPLRMWFRGERVLDEPLFWRSYQKQLEAAVLLPVDKGTESLLVEIGARPDYADCVKRDSPSRNRDYVLSEVLKRIPDFLTLHGRVTPDTQAPACSLRFLPGQFHREGMTWQEIVLRPANLPPYRPSTDYRSQDEAHPVDIAVTNEKFPGLLHQAPTPKEMAAGIRRLYVPVTAPGESLPPLRKPGKDPRVEPVVEIATQATIRVEGHHGAVSVTMPVFESLGRNAPQREFREVRFPPIQEILWSAPEPVLPPEWSAYKKLYDAAWSMLLKLVNTPRREGGFPNARVCTGASFGEVQFVWDSSFTAMATAYAWRSFPAYATMDVLYSRQFDGGYIHREHDGFDGLPLLFEPDFSPNPPIMSVAEWKIFSLTGNRERLAKVYRILADNHVWLAHNHKLPDGTYWTTGLANGLDNSPSLGDGYPDLTAQMAHDAETLGLMADALRLPKEAASWRREQKAIGAALNRKLWSESMQFYSTSLPDGGHNPNKVITGFWPLWANVVPPERIDALSRHLKDPSSFWRHHPIPSLAADSPHFVPGGLYWLGSTWAPTNYATIKGFERAGRLDLAREATLRHLQCMWEVYEATGKIWENYCSEKSMRGSLSGPDYCWSSLGPVALLLEVLIGIEPDAPHCKLCWTPPADKSIGVRHYPLGPCTVDLHQECSGSDVRLTITTDQPITLDFIRHGKTRSLRIPKGTTKLKVS